MLHGETVAVYCENHKEHTDTVRTSQETHYVSATKSNRLLLFGEQSLFIVRTKRNTDTFRTSQKTHYISVIKPNRLMPFGKQSLFIVRTIWNTQIQFVPHRKHNMSVITPHRLMLFGETIDIYCENHREHTNILCRQSEECECRLMS
jgi:hypothetical protein